MNDCTKIQASHWRGGGVRDERTDYHHAPARDETQGSAPDTGAVSESEVATPSSSSNTLSPKQIEKGLRAMGLSARQAKRLMSGGYAAYAGNVEPDEREALLAEALSFYRAISEYDL